MGVFALFGRCYKLRGPWAKALFANRARIKAHA
jgi:hypothetical protein